MQKLTSTNEEIQLGWPACAAAHDRVVAYAAAEAAKTAAYANDRRRCGNYAAYETAKASAATAKIAYETAQIAYEAAKVAQAAAVTAQIAKAAAEDVGHLAAVGALR